MSTFYPTFTRHAHGEGLKGHSTHYCAGCGHGLAHKYLAEAIDELGIQDRTVAVSPVGCAVFLYYYLDVGNTQAAHGRAPAVAIGHKTANPESIVISYQGDGDLASIGLAEIIQAAQLGIPISVIFINNAIYGMTGGQLAPTTLMGMKTATSPYGRTAIMGEPLRMAELIAQLEGPAYVERVGLFDNKQRVRAKKAITKGLQLQVENKGFSFVEVLAECPTHLKMSTEEAQNWVKESMLPVFPLGVKKDLEKPPFFYESKPDFAPQEVLDILGTSSEPAPQFAGAFPEYIDPDDIAIKFAGAGGDGAQTAAMLLTRASINENFDATHIPSYGPESRGGTSYADVHIARQEVLSPAAPHPHILLAFNAPSLNKFAPHVVENGIVVYDNSVINEIPDLSPSIRVVGVSFTEIARELGNLMVKNIVAIGALQKITNLLPADSLLYVIDQLLSKRENLIEINHQAFHEGQKAVEEVI